MNPLKNPPKFKFYCCLKMSALECEPETLNKTQEFGNRKPQTRCSSAIRKANTHKIKCSRERHIPPIAPLNAPKERQFCVAKIEENNATKAVAYFTNPLPLNSLKSYSKNQTDLALDSAKVSQIVKSTNIYPFDFVFCDKNIKTKLYQMSLSKSANLVYQNKSVTVFVLGSRENKIKKRFFLDDSSVFQKFLCDSKLKFEIFQKSEERDFEMSHRVSLVGFVNGKTFDFMKNTKQRIDGDKLTKTGIDTPQEISGFLERLSSTFSVLKTISNQQNFTVALKLQIKIVDQKTKMQCHASCANFVYFHLNEFQHDSLSGLKKCVLNSAGNKSVPLISGETVLSDFKKPNEFVIFNDFFAVSQVRFYVCLNGLFRNQATNKFLLDFAKQLSVDVKMSLAVNVEESRFRDLKAQHDFIVKTQFNNSFQTQNHLSSDKLRKQCDEIIHQTNQCRTTEERANCAELGLVLLEANSDSDLSEVGGFIDWLNKLFEILENSLSEEYRIQVRDRIELLAKKSRLDQQVIHQITKTGFFKQRFSSKGFISGTSSLFENSKINFQQKRRKHKSQKRTI